MLKGQFWYIDVLGSILEDHVIFKSKSVEPLNKHSLILVLNEYSGGNMKDGYSN